MEKNWSSDENKNRKKLKPWHGAVLFGIVMLSFYTIIAWAQMKWGMYGLALTELYLLFLSIFAVKLLKISVKGNISIEKTKMEKDTWGIADVGKLLCPYDTCYHVYGVLFPKADVCSQ